MTLHQFAMAITIHDYRIFAAICFFVLIGANLPINRKRF
jgi:hypothetical protein